MVKGSKLHKIPEEMLNCLPSLPNMTDLHKLEDITTSDLSAGWNVVDAVNNCLRERLFHADQTDPSVPVCNFLLLVKLRTLVNYYCEK